MNKGKNGINLFMKHPLLLSEKPLYPQTNKPISKVWPYKKIIEKESIAKSSEENKVGKKIWVENITIKDNGNIDKSANPII